MKASYKKEKGRKLELLIAKRLRLAGLDKNASRTPLSGAVTGFKSDITTTLPFAIEAKNQQTWSPAKYMQQAEEAADQTNKMPVVVMSKNRQPDPYVMMKLSDWINILQRAFIENKTPVISGKMSYSKHQQTK